MRNTLWIIAVSLMLISCGGAGPAKSALSSALRNLETARSTNCVHESLELAEKSYTKAQQLFDEEKYDDAEKEARVADQLAAEAHKATNGVPCPLEKPKVKVIKEVPADIQQETFVPEELPELKVIRFAFDSSALTPQAIAMIQDNMGWLKKNESVRIVLGGHCDSRGTSAYNLALSERRAIAVFQYLVKSGLDPNRFEVVGYGSEILQDYNESDQAHTKNRRVEFQHAK